MAACSVRPRTLSKRYTWTSLGTRAVECVATQRAAMGALGMHRFAIASQAWRDDDRMRVTGLRVVRVPELVYGGLHRRTKRLSAQQCQGGAMQQAAL